MLIDDITIKTFSGKGGDGKAAFNKTKMSLGPTGGSGGKGGSVYAEGISDLSRLNQFRFKKEFGAENGKNGNPQFRDGADGKDLILKVPVGTVIHNLTTKENIEITKVGEIVLIAVGGRGGKGNFLFRSSRNTSPKQFQLGKPGSEHELHLELKLIADVGFVGLPNIGKTSLLNALTNTKSKVANYLFTTLEPNLGTYYELILADIPGLIEGASDGKGLGIKFLKHIERTKIIFHFLSAESEDPIKDYQLIKKELNSYNPNLLKKPEYVFLSKSDTISEAEIDKKLSEIKKISPGVIAISLYDEKSIDRVKSLLNKIIEDKIFKKKED
ncbi:MAG: GTPase ObgE [Parcubacteria group bacterium]|jgi:GTP-binding protein